MDAFYFTIEKSEQLISRQMLEQLVIMASPNPRSPKMTKTASSKRAAKGQSEPSRVVDMKSLPDSLEYGFNERQMSLFEVCSH
jgi:hypothetical protein